MNLAFTILDVFAEEKYAGNQLTVVRGAADLPDETLQKITREMNYSETTFVLSEEERDGGYDVRIFTPGGEIPSLATRPSARRSRYVTRSWLNPPNASS